jgi:transcriptional regulator with XRE-family HTH domain
LSRNEIVAEKLVKLRGDKSRETVAKACGISISALAMYERGERIPRDDIKVRLAEYYNRSVNFIFFDLNEHKKCTKEA